MLLKLEHLVDVPSLAIDDFLEELHFLLKSVSVPLSVAGVQQVFEKHLHVDELIIKEIAATISASPFSMFSNLILLTLYADDLEKKYKLFAVHWILSNLPPGSHSSLSSIYLALLCKSEDLKHYGYEKRKVLMCRQTKDLRNKDLHKHHHLSYFNVLSAYPPGVLHDIFEGVVPIELAQCLALLISKKYFTLESLNESILQFPYKWEDQRNKPHAIPVTFSRNTIGGNAHENWSRFLPFLIGNVVPEGEPTWQVLMDLKDIAELVVSPVNTDESISYLEMKISEHRQRYQESFPDIKLLPKHHHLEHYPEMVKSFDPLVHLWRMRFEAKQFFKQVARHTNCFKNVPRSLAVKHQLMISYHLKSSHEKGTLEVSTALTVPLDVLQTEVAQMIRDKFPNVSEVHVAKSVSNKSMNFRNGMILAHDTTSGLPDFGEIVQICVVQEVLCFILRPLCGWYREHFRAFENTVSSTIEMFFVEHGDLADSYPLSDYMVGPLRLVTLKRQVHP
ncbi:Shikimate kinase [Labeo rohita]|uniref:Shikimate kinase n=1 Tax=Labeo rohita TaxID=84645 RepID=A0ABQ8L2Q1_LABRO|nr:Shikimate kinase [Labeo rohita]